MKIKFSLLFICVYSSISNLYSVSAGKICNHAYPKHDQVLHAHIEPFHVMKKRSADQPLRILLKYDDSVYRLDEERFRLINNTILPDAVQFWEKALFVRRSENVIRLTRKCQDTQIFVKDGYTHCIGQCKRVTTCGEVEVPEEHLDACRVCNHAGKDCHIAEGSQQGPGVKDHDFVLYISAMQTERCDKPLTVAYAAHCQQETALDRPIAGHANLCPNSISTKRQNLEILLSTVKHEILHALGFSMSLFAFYRDPQGNPYTPRNSDTGKPLLNETLQTFQWSDKVIKTVVRNDWLVRSRVVSRSMEMMVTPNVVREVRNYFNCSTLEGAELEDQGEDGTVLTHWEKRVFENEAMTGTHTQNPIISRITLALMEDTGWYVANYSQAGEMTWGRNLGCDFVTKSCKEWMLSKSGRGMSIHPFCEKVKGDPVQTECTDDRTSVALCNLIRYDYALPEIYQNFDRIKDAADGDERFYGGSVSLADYCPYIQEFTWKANDVIVRGSHCQFSENNPIPEKNFALELYGNHSLCFEHSKHMWEERTCSQMRQWQHWGSGCYAYKCEKGRLHILVGNYTYTCYHANQELQIKVLSNDWLHKGAILCPPCKEICANQFAARGEVCESNEESPPANLYPRDELDCSAFKIENNLVLILFISVLVNYLNSI